jgi:carboxymethylenebutenolidase
MNWMQRYVGEELIEDHHAGRLSRRDLLRQLVGVCGSITAAAAFLAACGDDGAAPSATGTNSTTSSPTTSGPMGGTTSTTASATSSSTTTAPPSGGATLAVRADDPAIRAENVQFSGPAGPVFGYLARPSTQGRRAGVLVVHENRGLTDHIRDVTRRLAKSGYLALAVDLASRSGGTDKVADTITAVLSNGKPEDRVADLNAGYAYLQSQSDFTGKLGITGFCFGGGVTMLYAASQPAVLAAVPYYGTPPSPISVMAQTKAAFLIHYGATDARVNATRADAEAALAGKTVQVVVHEGAGHAFNNDTGAAYNEAAAVAAWRQTLNWFATHLA